MSGASVDAAILARRTVKEFLNEPVEAGLIAELLALAVQAPNHHLTEPWRMWVVGPETIARMTDATGDRKLRRSATAIVFGVLPGDDPVAAREDEHACAAAIQTLLLAATARGLVTFWRTPGVARNPAFATLLGAAEGTRIIGWVHVGRAAGPPPSVERRSAEPHTTWLP